MLGCKLVEQTDIFHKLKSYQFLFIFKINILANRSRNLLNRFSQNDRYFSVDCRFDPFLRSLKGRCHGNPIFNGKSPKSAYTHLYSSPWHSETDCQKLRFWFQKFICDDLATLYVNLVNFGPVTPEFTKVKDVHLWDKLSQDSPDKFSPNFHLLVFIWP